jgi:hypothetical protein
MREQRGQVATDLCSMSAKVCPQKSQSPKATTHTAQPRPPTPPPAASNPKARSSRTSETGMLQQAGRSLLRSLTAPVAAEAAAGSSIVVRGLLTSIPTVGEGAIRPVTLVIPEMGAKAARTSPPLSRRAHRGGADGELIEPSSSPAVHTRAGARRRDRSRGYGGRGGSASSRRFAQADWPPLQIWLDGAIDARPKPALREPTTATRARPAGNRATHARGEGARAFKPLACACMSSCMNSGISRLGTGASGVFTLPAPAPPSGRCL